MMKHVVFLSISILYSLLLWKKGPDHSITVTETDHTLTPLGKIICGFITEMRKAKQSRVLFDGNNDSTDNGLHLCVWYGCKNSQARKIAFGLIYNYKNIFTRISRMYLVYYSKLFFCLLHSFHALWAPVDRTVEIPAGNLRIWSLVAH